MSVKRILMTADTVGGVWTYALELVRGLGESGVEVALATMGSPLTSQQRLAAESIATLEVFESNFKLEWMENPWDDVEGLFTPGKDFLVAHTGEEMKRHLSELLQNEDTRKEIAQHGRQTILTRHTCAHRVDELLNIYAELEGIQQQKVVTA